VEKSLNGKRVAILVAEGFEQSELEAPKQALDQAGAETLIVSPAEEGWVQGWQHFDLGDLYEVDVPLAEADAAEFDALLLPGGVANPDRLRMQPQAVEFVRAFFDAGKPVAAICHAPWTLIEAGLVTGRTLTSYPSLRTDIRNAGGKWVDEEVVVDGGLVSSRNPDDLPAFCAKLVEEFAEGRHERQTESITAQSAEAGVS
jgi:protease I